MSAEFLMFQVSVALSHDNSETDEKHRVRYAELQERVSRLCDQYSDISAMVIF